ncbi:hypothetical protein [Micromonospora sp. b486]|uniref:hypothetical protein n=1 Tax=Micromonospora sp. b486 TaxID=3053986 RepID=UPI00259C9095|nr:hypothetical protein [Micromonospora sp. b486]MDM4784479.1 hypothetical protein [Micromonospora sp. b486]
MDENGTEYAVYGPNAGEMRKGELVTLRLTARDRSVDCGPASRCGSSRSDRR